LFHRIGQEVEMTFNIRTPLTWGLALALAVTFGSTSRAQTPAAQPDSAKPEKQMAGMMAIRQKMMAEMQASQKRLDDLLAAANAAQGTDKVDRLTAVVAEMVAQHRQMGMRMMSMGGMMQGPMAPSAAGAAPPAPAAAAPAAPAEPPPAEQGHSGHHSKP
jgi:hypothetical protein